MSDKRATFLEQCLAGACGPEDIDAFEELWHQSQSPGSLASYLGFTEEEYALIVEQPALLNYVLVARKLGIPLEAALNMTKKFAETVGSRLRDDPAGLATWLKARKHA